MPNGKFKISSDDSELLNIYCDLSNTAGSILNDLYHLRSSFLNKLNFESESVADDVVDIFHLDSFLTELTEVEMELNDFTYLFVNLLEYKAEVGDEQGIFL